MGIKIVFAVAAYLVLNGIQVVFRTIIPLFYTVHSHAWKSESARGKEHFRVSVFPSHEKRLFSAAVNYCQRGVL